MNHRLALIVLGALFLSLSKTQPAASGSTSVGSVLSLTGTVELTRAGQLSNPRVNSAVLLDDDFTTKPASSLTVMLDGGSQLELGESSSIRIDQTMSTSVARPRSTLVALILGQVHSIVPFLGADTYRVTTENAVCGVRGTDFTVSFSQGYARPGYGGCGDYTDVKVDSGVVEVANPHTPSQPVAVKEGYATTVPCLHAPLTPGPVGLAAAGVPIAPAGAPPPPICPPCSMFNGHVH
jgi:ferric-dicitrate binding protein FerR (iron transport regulator)